MFIKISNWYSKRKSEKKKKKVYYYLRLGYTFLKWIENQLGNRHAKKQFYSDILHNGVVNSSIVQMCVQRIDTFLNLQKSSKKEATKNEQQRLPTVKK